MVVSREEQLKTRHNESRHRPGQMKYRDCKMKSGMKKLKWLTVPGVITGLMLVLSAMPALAGNGVTVSISAPAEAAVGSSFIARVDISHVELLGGAQYNVSFDS